MAEMRRVRVRNQDRGTVLADCATVADTSQLRRTGLLKHERLEPGEGLWIVPSEAVHTFGMKFAIDVLFLDKRKRVRKIRADMGKRRIAVDLLGYSVLELPAGVAAATGTAPGDQLVFEKL
jgi:uncharacterized membrane protein (UPF0127 family)